MKNYILLILGVIFLIAGAILKVFHIGEAYAETVYVIGFVLCAVYLFMRSRSIQKQVDENRKKRP